MAIDKMPQQRGLWLLCWIVCFVTLGVLLDELAMSVTCTHQHPTAGQTELTAAHQYFRKALAEGHKNPAGHANPTPAPRRPSYIPTELQRLLVCITIQFNVAKTSHWEVMLLETARYESPILDVILVTDNADALKHVVDRMMLPLTVSYYQTQQPSDDNNKYWLTWEHRKAIEQSVAKNNYTTVVYMEDDTRLTWPALVSWAVDTRLLAAQNHSRCFFRTEVRPADGGLAMLDYRSGIDVRPESPLKRLDMQATDGKLYSKVVEELTGRACGKLPNGTDLPCIANRHFTATPFPFQGMWLATNQQLSRFTSMPIWTKQGALAFRTATYLEGTLGVDLEWGYPEKSASIAIFGGLTDIPPGPATRGSCMLPYHPRSSDHPAELADVARIDHLRNAYATWGSIPVEQRIIS